MSFCQLSSRPVPIRLVDGPTAIMDPHSSPHMSDSQKPTSPQTSYSSESEVKSGMTQLNAKRRPSRAGTRSVATLTAAQLERKRANDREAQRAIRQRTKEHIESLERRIQQLTSTNDAAQKLVDAMQRNQELELENTILRARLNQGLRVYSPEGESFAAESSLMRGRSPPCRLDLPRPSQLASTPTARIPSMTPGVSQAEHWRQPAPTATLASNIGATSGGDPSSWSQHHQNLPRPFGQHDSPGQPVHGVDLPVPSQSAPSGYGYAAQYQPPEQVHMSYEQQQQQSTHALYHPMEYQPRTMASDVSHQPPTSYASYSNQQSYMSGSPLPQTSQQHQSGSQQMMHSMPPDMKP